MSIRGETKTPLSVEVREVGPQRYLSRSARAPLAGVGSVVQEGFAALYHRLEETGATPSGPPFLVAGYPKDGYLDVELGAPCAGPPAGGAGFEPRTLPAGRVAVTVFRGPYAGLAAVYEELRKWIAAHGLTVGGPPREVYLTPPGQEPVTEIVWPLID